MTIRSQLDDLHDALAMRVTGWLLPYMRKREWSIYAGSAAQDSRDEQMTTFMIGFAGGIVGMLTVFVGSLIVEWWMAR